VFRAAAADRAYGTRTGFRSELAEAGLPFVMALKPVMGPGPSAPVPAPAGDFLDLTAGQAQQQFRELSRRAPVSSGSQAEQRLDRSLGRRLAWITTRW
jgi:hypothetical protein